MRMRLDLTVEELEILRALLDAASREHQHEIHHTDSREFRSRLERETEVIEALRARLASAPSAR
jgi:hypothetical protein